MVTTMEDGDELNPRPSGSAVKYKEQAHAVLVWALLAFK